MGYTMSEKRVHKKLGIKDFRHMTKDKVVKFAGLLHKMDPEVAKKALDQFPEFKDYSIELVKQYKEILDRILEGNSFSQRAAVDACVKILDSLKMELEDEHIDAEERSRIEDKMIQVAKMIHEKDSENKRFHIKVFGLVSGVCAVSIVALAAVLGVNVSVPSTSEGEDGDGEDDEEEC